MASQCKGTDAFVSQQSQQEVSDLASSTNHEHCHVLGLRHASTTSEALDECLDALVIGLQMLRLGNGFPSGIAISLLQILIGTGEPGILESLLQLINALASRCQQDIALQQLAGTDEMPGVKLLVCRGRCLAR